MYKNRYMKFAICVSLTTLLTIGMGFTPTAKSDTEPTNNVATIGDKTKVHIEDVTQLHSEKISTNKPNVTIDYLKPFDNDVKQKEDKKEVEKNDQENFKLYAVVNVQYLNVRKQPNPDSAILETLVKDWVIEVRGEEGNGWLLLKSGGYIKGKYATELSKEEASKRLSSQNKKAKPHPKFTQPKEAVGVVSNGTEKHVLKSVVYRPSNGIVYGGIVNKSNATVGQIHEIVAGSALDGIETAAKQVEDTFGVNALFVVAVAKLESGHGTSTLARTKNNLFGMNAVDNDPYGSGYTYNSKASSVLDFGRLIKEKYINQGLTTLASIQQKYCSSSSWSAKVSNIMYSDVSRINKQ